MTNVASLSSACVILALSAAVASCATVRVDEPASKGDSTDGASGASGASGDEPAATGGTRANTGGATSRATGGSTSSTGGTSLGTGGTSLGTGGSPPAPVDVSLPYTDDFEDGDFNGWAAYNKSDDDAGSWSIVADTTQVASQTAAPGDIVLQVGGDLAWSDIAFAVRVRFDDPGATVLVMVRFVDGRDYYFLQIQPGSKPKIRSYIDASSSDVCASETAFEPVVGTWYTVLVTAQGSNLSASIDAAPVCSGTDAQLPNGGVAFGTDEGPASFDDVSVTAP